VRTVALAGRLAVARDGDPGDCESEDAEDDRENDCKNVFLHVGILPFRFFNPHPKGRFRHTLMGIPRSGIFAPTGVRV
jgi:hypothetical protein